MEGAEARGPPRIKDVMLADAQEMVITNLQPETTYSITVAAYTMKGDGARSKPKVVVTKGAVLGRPTLSVQQTPEGSLLARWEPPAGTTEDQVLGYRLQFGREDSSPLATLEFLPTEDHYTASGVHKGATYVFRLAARSRVSPKNFKVKMIMKTSVLLSWEFPDNYNSPTPYKIQYNGLTLDVDGRTTKKLITHLKPHTFYNFVLTNRGSSLGGLQQTVTAWTAFNLLSGKPSVAPKPNTDGFIMVYLPDGQSPVPVQNYFIVMVPLRKSRGGQFLTPLGSPEDMDLEEPGDQKQYGGFDNRGLEPGHRYVLFVLAVLQKSEPTFAASPFSDPFQLDNPDPQPIVDGEEGLIWVIGPVLAVVFIICIVIAILLYKNKPDSKRKDSEPRTKCLLNNADLAPHHPKDPVEMRRINFQTPASPHCARCSQFPIPSFLPAPGLELSRVGSALQPNEAFAVFCGELKGRVKPQSPPPFFWQKELCFCSHL
ncbi:Receptor-type tyrosine-protein phosphatase S [Myotis brandtii]|uniref:Receptor-type tyrosine-protein phosphatase S n=1 Tax=Myotis brandtii TaxID=109478 RepID=S7NQQ1_MYOBR|nr:Receptor-type tyrosine-protein phosphatase S [Myotis brandtii]